MKAAPARIPAWGVLAGAAYSLFYAPVQRKLLSSPGAEDDRHKKLRYSWGVGLEAAEGDSAETSC